MNLKKPISKTVPGLPFLADLDAIAVDLSEIANPNLRPNSWLLILRRCPFYPVGLRTAAMNHVSKRVAALSTVKPKKTKGTKAPDPFRGSKRLHHASLSRLPYQQFLASEYWMAFRAEKIKESGNCCSSCGAADQLHVHHLRYSNRGFECFRPRDTVVLCACCHAQRHKENL
jgi:hypothetical protein